MKCVRGEAEFRGIVIDGIQLGTDSDPDASSTSQP